MFHVEYPGGGTDLFDLGDEWQTHVPALLLANGCLQVSNRLRFKNTLSGTQEEEVIVGDGFSNQLNSEGIERASSMYPILLSHLSI